jgi:methionyl-tRNA synthetase
MTRSFYVTTPIYYVNGAPQLGNAYSTVVADAIARYHRLQGRDVFFLTGTDEHGINNERAARARGVTPQQHTDELAAAFTALWHTLDVSYDRFIRTTEAQHKRGALAFWERLLASGDIYRATYAGAYCARCEAYFQEDELLAADTGSTGTGTGKRDVCPVHRVRVEQLEEENYFFRLSRYQEALEHVIRDTDFVQPTTRRNEVLAVLKQGLRDFSVTRRNVRWGISVPGHPDEVFYVWVDALANYLTGVGYPDDVETFNRFWPADVHLVGKDIIRFHCLYWPALLLSAKLQLPKRVFAHGWLTRGGQKLSKSGGNSFNPTDLAARYGADAVRYFLLRAVPFGQDGDVSEEQFVARYNAELANDFGNLVQRALSLVTRCNGGVVPERGKTLTPATTPERVLIAEAESLPGRVAAAFDRIAPDAALDAIFSFVRTANRYAEETAPWQLVKTADSDPVSRARLDSALYYLTAAARLACWFLWPFVPATASEGHFRLCGEVPAFGQDALNALSPGTRVSPGSPLFPRVTVDGPQGA